MENRTSFEIIKRKENRIKKHKATIYMLLGSARSYLKEEGDYESTDVLMVIKTKEKFTGHEWAKLIVRFQRDLDKMTGDRF